MGGMVATISRAAYAFRVFRGATEIAALAALTAFVAAGCSSTACTNIGCTDTFTATVKSADGSFPIGMHRVEILAGGATVTCTVAFAETSPGIGGIFAPCPSGLAVMVGNAQLCTETHMGNSVSQRCDPIPGEFVERI